VGEEKIKANRKISKTLLAKLKYLNSPLTTLGVKQQVFLRLAHFGF
jgi:hypothetical protein